MTKICTLPLPPPSSLACTCLILVPPHPLTTNVQNFTPKSPPIPYKKSKSCDFIDS